jgi:cell division protein FtsN
VDLALGASVLHRGVVGTVVHLLRRHAPDNAVAVLHQAAEQLRPPVDPDQRSYAERLRERLGMVPRPATPERPRCTCKPTRVQGMGGLFRDPSCPTHGEAPVRPPTGL